MSGTGTWRTCRTVGFHTIAAMRRTFGNAMRISTQYARTREVTGGKRPRDTEAQTVVPIGTPDADGRAEVPWTVTFGSAASHTEACVCALTPHGAVRLRSVVDVVKWFLDPLPHVPCMS